MNWSALKQRMYQLRTQPLVTGAWVVLGSDEDVYGPRAYINPPNTLFRLLDMLPRP